MSTCSFTGCGRKVIAKKLCGGHYKQQSRGEPLTPLRAKIPGRKCTVGGCDRKYFANGYCRTHLERHRVGADMATPIRQLLKTDVDLATRLRTYAPEGEPDECWEWTRARVKDYGMISIGNGKLRGAHIVAWELANDRSLPDGLVIRHTCDNPPCTNPAHLIVGTHSDNVDDKVERGRQDAGEKQALAKLTNADIAEICQLYANGASQRQLAEQFRVSQSNISLIVRGKAWSHLEQSSIPPDARPRHFRLTEDTVRQIRSLYGSGAWSQARLAHKFNVSRALISLVVNRKIWSNVE